MAVLTRIAPLIHPSKRVLSCATAAPKRRRHYIALRPSRVKKPFSFSWMREPESTPRTRTVIRHSHGRVGIYDPIQS